MAFSGKMYQSQQLKQEMKINPRLYQAMELLYMPLLDLQQHLKQELAENPFLEMTDPDAEQEVELKEETKPQKEEKNTREEIDWEEILLDGFYAGGRRPQYEEREFYQPTVFESSDLRDHLEDQLRLLDLTERELRLGEEIIGNINDDGMLSCTLEEVVSGVNGWLAELKDLALEKLADLDAIDRGGELIEIEEEFSPYALEEAERMLQRIQLFDPPGVAA